MEVQQIQETDYDHHEIIDNRSDRTMGWRFDLKFLVPQQFHSKIKRARKGTKKWLEGNTKIYLPTKNEANKVVVKGNSEEEVIGTKNRIVQFISGSVSRQTLTHFLSVVFTTEEVKRNFATFRDEIINEMDLHKSLFQKPEKLHVTVVMLALEDEDANVKARECLAKCKETIIDPILEGQPLTVAVTGISLFEDQRPQAARVVFGNVLSEKLQQIANRIAKYFAEQELIRLDEEEVKLHLTLINTSFYKPERKGSNRRQSKRHPGIDATKIIEKYKDFNFGTVTLNEIQINQIGTVGEDGFYLSIGSLQF